MKKSIVLVDDNAELLEAIEISLSSEFRIHCFTNPVDALAYVSISPVEAVILDLNIPGHDMFNCYKKLKEINPLLPVLFLSGEASLEMKVKCLNVGADDFISKPVHREELIARINNRIAFLKMETKKITIKNMTIDVDTHQVLVDDKSIILTPKEFSLLLTLAKKPNRVVNKEEIIKELWSGVHVELNNLDTHFSNLRKKLGCAGSMIKTLKNLGYVIRPNS